MEHLRREDFEAETWLGSVCSSKSPRKAQGLYDLLALPLALSPHPCHVGKARLEGSGPRQNCVCHLDISGGSLDETLQWLVW